MVKPIFRMVKFTSMHGILTILRCFYPEDPLSVAFSLTVNAYLIDYCCILFIDRALACSLAQPSGSLKINDFNPCISSHGYMLVLIIWGS